MLIAKPSRRAVEALASLDGHPDFEAVKQYLTEVRQDLITQGMEGMADIPVRQAQGAYQAVDSFLHYASQARSLIRGQR